MDILSFKNSLKNASFKGIYLFTGEEDYLERYYLKKQRDRVSPD